MSGRLRASNRGNSASGRCQAKNPLACIDPQCPERRGHIQSLNNAVAAQDINAFIDAKNRQKTQIDVPAKSPYSKTYNEVMSDMVHESGGNLKPSQKAAAIVLAKMYESGQLESAHASLIKFNNRVPEIKKDEKTIGIVYIGNLGNPYFYEVNGDNVTFRQGDGFDTKGEKLPWNYSMRKKLDGKAITENNIKWGAEAMLARYGF